MLYLILTYSALQVNDFETCYYNFLTNIQQFTQLEA